MRVVETHDPEVMRLDDDSALLRVLGLVPILSGVGLWQIYLNAETGPGKEPGVWGLLLVLGACFVLAVVGLGMMLYAGQTIIDRRLMKVVHWQRFLWWQPQSVHDLAGFDRVAVVHSRGRYRTWGVALLGGSPQAEREVLCGLGLPRADAAALASRIAVFAGLAADEAFEVR